jgi:phage terminase large subunit-like protein
LDWRVIWDPFIPKDGMIERINKDHVPYDQWEKGHWITATDGNVIDYTEIEKRILLWKDLYNVQEVPADRAFATMLVQRLEQAGLTVVDVPQTFVSLTDPMNSVETLLKTGAMTHETSPVARWCFGNTSIAKNGNEQIKYVKEHRGKSLVRTKRIDTTAAWVIAMARARFYVGKIDLNAKILSGNWGM